MDHKTKEALRYLGYGRNPGEERTLELIRQSFEELEGLREERIVWRREPVTVREPDQVETAGMDIRSRGLARNLKGCREVILAAATLGTRTDLLLRRYSRTDMTRAVILQACAAARLEEYLDAWQEERKKELEEEGLYLRPRFSPGYGDFSIHHQKALLQRLEAPKRIGLTMTDGYMLTPSKSVTALVGISLEETACHRQGCESCGKIDCAYRRE